MSNFKTQVIRNLKPYSKYVEELNKPALRNIIQGIFQNLSKYMSINFLHLKFVYTLSKQETTPQRYMRRLKSNLQVLGTFLNIMTNYFLPSFNYFKLFLDKRK